MKLIYIATPISDNAEETVQFAKEVCRSVVDSGCALFSPPLLYSSILDVTNPERRKLSSDMSMSVLTRCDEFWTFGNPLSKGIFAEMNQAKKLGIPVRHFELERQMNDVRAIELERVTVRTFLQEHPQATVYFMTPGGYAAIAPEDIPDVLHGGALTAHAGARGTERSMEAEELLRQVICQMYQDQADANTFHLLTDLPKQTEAPAIGMSPFMKM